MTVAPTAGVCGDAKCPVLSGGACLLGHADPLDCEAFEPAEPAEETSSVELDGDDTDAVARVADESPRGHVAVRLAGSMVALHSGEALSAYEATRILQRTPAKVVVSVGPVNVGKTTLLAGIYETVAREASHHAFAGSLSLIGFEARCFAASAASRRTVAETERTTRDTDKLLLHLRVSRDECTSELLLADVSGENAHDLLRFNDPGQYAPLLRAASNVLLLVDGDRIARPTERHGCVEEARTLIRALAESRLISDDCVFTVVVTKGDILPDDDADVTSAVAEVTTAARNFWPAAGELTVKARAVDSTTSGEATRIPELLDLLIDTPAARYRDVALPPTAHIRAAHAFQPASAVLARYQARRRV